VSAYQKIFGRHRRLRKIGIGLTVAAVVSGALTAPAPAAAAVAMETVFNTPTDDAKPDHAIEARIVKLVDGTPAGAKIDFSVYSWTRDPVAEALKRAQARGVQVRVAIDGGADDNPEKNSPSRILKAAKLTKLVFCGKGGKFTACIANRGTPHSINHQKLWMFSQTEGKSNVVGVGSHNLTNSQGSLFNNALFISGDANLYNFYRGHVDKMLAQKHDNKYFNNGGYHDSPTSAVTSYLSPRADSGGGTKEEFSTDTWAQLLKWITKKETGCRLDVAHANIADSRTYPVNEIVRIGKLGCQVRVIYGTIGANNLKALKGKANVSLKRYSDNDTNNFEKREVTLHSKEMIYRGNYNGKAGRKIVFTGSHNLSGSALRNNDEILIKVENTGVAGAYDKNFSTMWSRAKCTKPKSGSCP
jgi:phosphatidylserine/phosphatidylglycerophosphate/cardiolipin synthase-like enzyme